jgi:hypothetical protein
MATVEPSFFPFLALPEELRQRVYYWHIVRVTDGTEYDPFEGHRDALLTVCKTVSDGYLSALFRETRVMLRYDFQYDFAVCGVREPGDASPLDLDVTCRRLSNKALSLSLVVDFGVWEPWKTRPSAAEMSYIARVLMSFQRLRDLDVRVGCQSRNIDRSDWIAKDIVSVIRKIDTVCSFSVAVCINECSADTVFHHLAERRTIVDGRVRWVPCLLNESPKGALWMVWDPLGDVHAWDDACYDVVI